MGREMVIPIPAPAGEKEPSHYTSQGGVAGGWGVVVVVEMVEEEAAEVVREVGARCVMEDWQSCTMAANSRAVRVRRKMRSRWRVGGRSQRERKGAREGQSRRRWDRVAGAWWQHLQVS